MQNTTIRPLIVSIAVVLIAAGAFGCNKSRRDLAAISGKVTYQGKPLTFGSIMFQPESGQFATGDIQSDGTFKMTTRGEGDGVAIGPNKVRIVCFEGQAPSAKSGATSGQVSLSEASPLGKALVPEKYLSFETSGITVNVKHGVNETIALDLK